MSEITDRICRACLEPQILEPSIKTYPLVGRILNVNVNIATMLEYCTSKKLDLSENLPQDVCLSCFKIIRLAYNFLKQFQESQEKLLELRNGCKEEQEVHEDKCDGITSKNSNQYNLRNNHDYSLESQTSRNKYKNEDPDSIDETQSESVSEDSSNEMYENESDENKDEEMEDSNQSNDEEAIDEITYLESFDPEIFELNYVEDESEMCVKVESPNSNDNDIGEAQTSEIPSEMKLEQAEEKVVQPAKDPFVSVMYKCPICPGQSNKYRLFHQHVLSHRMKKIVCTRCVSKAEFLVDKYFEHYKDVHKYQCDICNKCLSSGYGYQYHMKHHQDIKKHKCPYEGCEKSYLYGSLLNKHLRFHNSKQSVHPCDQCNSTFRSVYSLKYHKRTHEGERNHLCIHCGKAFYQAVHLKDHVNRHTGNRAFTCDICGKSFITNFQLKKHIKLCMRKNLRIT